MSRYSQDWVARMRDGRWSDAARARNNETLAQRFVRRVWSKVDQSAGPDACWPWLGTINPGDGYGCISFLCRKKTAHRVVYEMSVGPIPAGLQIDHLCRNRSCVNPAHLEPVTHTENIRRGVWADARARLTCRRGHAYPPYEPGVKRYCHECQRLRLSQRRREPAA